MAFAAVLIAGVASANMLFPTADATVGEIYVNTDDNGNYELLTAGPYNDELCEHRNQHTCAYEQISDDQPVPSSFDRATADALVAEGILAPASSKTGIYLGN